MRGPSRRLKGDPDWRHFERWCRARRLKALPAHPWTVAAYMRWCETRARADAIGERLQAISRIHVLSGRPTPERHPVVARTLGVVERRVRQRGNRAALFTAPDGEASSAGATGRRAAATRAPRRSLRQTPRLVRRETSSDGP